MNPSKQPMSRTIILTYTGFLHRHVIPAKSSFNVWRDEGENWSLPDTTVHIPQLRPFTILLLIYPFPGTPPLLRPLIHILCQLLINFFSSLHSLNLCQVHSKQSKGSGLKPLSQMNSYCWPAISDGCLISALRLQWNMLDHSKKKQHELQLPQRCHPHSQTSQKYLIIFIETGDGHCTTYLLTAQNRAGSTGPRNIPLSCWEPDRMCCNRPLSGNAVLWRAH